MVSKQPRVSIIMLHMNGRKVLDDCLKSIEKTNYSNFEVMLLFNGTSDESEKAVLGKKHVHLFKSKINLGFTSGTKYLLDIIQKQGKSDYILLVNDDMEFDKDWIKELVVVAQREKTGIVCSKILQLKNKKMFDYGGAAGGLIDHYGYPFCRGRVFDTMEQDRGQYDEDIPLIYGTAGGMLISLKLIKKIGFLDEDYVAYHEEVDFCWRANIAGEKVFFAHKSKVYHLGHFTYKKEKMMDHREYLLHRNTFVSFLKNTETKNLIPLLLPRIGLELLAGAMFFPKKTIAVIRSFGYLIPNLPHILRKRAQVQKLRKVRDKDLVGILRKSIMFQYFVKGNKTYTDIV